MWKSLLIIVISKREIATDGNKQPKWQDWERNVSEAFLGPFPDLKYILGPFWKLRHTSYHLLETVAGCRLANWASPPSRGAEGSPPPLCRARRARQTACSPDSWSYRARQGGEVHVSGGSCLFVLVVALKWSRQGNTWSHFCRELHKQQRLFESWWFHFRTREHPQNGKGC